MRQLLRRGASLRVRTVTLAVMAVGILVLSGLALASSVPRADAYGAHPLWRTASPVFTVSFRFTYVSTPRPPNLAEARIAGSGSLEFDEAPPALTDTRTFGAVASQVKGAKVVVELDLLTPHPRTEELLLEVTNLAAYRLYETDTGKVRKQVLTLGVRVKTSTIPSCEKGDFGAARVVHTADANYLSLEICGFHIASPNPLRAGRKSRLQVNIQSHCLRQTAAVGQPLCGSPAPTRLTLTVNGWSLTATKAKPAVYLHHEEDAPLASATPLTIRASLDHPLPKGWKMIVYHNGDVLSQGNGVYYVACEVDGPRTATSCGATRPGRVGPFDDLVWVALTAPTYLAMHSDIYFHFNAP